MQSINVMKFLPLFLFSSVIFLISPVFSHAESMPATMVQDTLLSFDDVVFSDAEDTTSEGELLSFDDVEFLDATDMEEDTGEALINAAEWVKIPNHSGESSSPG